MHCHLESQIRIDCILKFEFSNVVARVGLILFVSNSEPLKLVDVVFMLSQQSITFTSIVSRGSIASTFATRANDSIRAPVSTRTGSQMSRLLLNPAF